MIITVNVQIDVLLSSDNDTANYLLHIIKVIDYML